MTLTRIIVASHGTAGAKAAENVALELCKKCGASLHHLLVVPDFWKGMMGDDWLNNAVTQARFGSYVESELAREAAAEIERLENRAKKARISHSHEVRFGKPAQCLLKLCEKNNYGLAVIGSARPKKSPGLRSRMDLEELARTLNTCLLIVPHPMR